MKNKLKNLVILFFIAGFSLFQAEPTQSAGSGIVYLPIVESRDQGVINKYAEIEPNDSKEQANRIFTNQVYSGRAEDESDYYIFTMGQSGPVTITLNNAPVGAQMLLSTMPMTVVNGAPYVIQIPALAKGQYALKIYTPPQSASSNWIYTFEVVTNNNPPEAPSYLSPANGGIGQSLKPQLSWTGNDSDGDLMAYDVYLGTDNPPATLVSNDQTGISYNSGILLANTNYYWKVLARDEHGLETSGPVWSFRTRTNQAPSMPSSPSPADGRMGISTDKVLSWMSGDAEGDAVTYDVYFGTENPPVTLVSDDQSGLSYDPTLATNTPYFWKVTAKDEYGLETAGPVWSFTTGDGVVLEGMVYVPAENFLRGCVEGNNGGYSCDADELPSGTIYLDAFYMDKTLVTNAQYAVCVAAGNCTAPSNSLSSTRTPYYGNPTYANYPVIWVTWNQAVAYCTWAGKRLPTEAEWEKAARGTDGRAFPWGSAAPTCSLANHKYYDGESYTYCVGDTSSVGSYPAGASPYGALDMAGNVDEWVSDWYDDSYYSVSPSSNPTGPTTGTHRVLRGGGWGNSGGGIRAASRNRSNPTYNNSGLGFRCAVPE